ncbi:hypothetical protein BG015_000188 [Linnemannia schmuckeri]|uniref:Survival Motor Neuron Gemin2-binding domain-containing protein n=1 Tax=Linnemannia schmuckeri TaxID=64567 RepID=A0A9P5RTW4_9FUNG|nr:hypothetical protein BG015_000188 [Linnemannia schmuckeri]
MAEEYEEEYCDDEEGDDYNKEEDDAAYDYNEEGSGEGGDIQVGEEIDLTHEEVWDDSALIEAWDMAVKQYEVYHSKTNPNVSSKDNSKDKIAKSSTPMSPNKHKQIDSAQQLSTFPTKRMKLKHNNEASMKSQPTRSEPDSSPTPTASQARQPPSKSTDLQYDVSERKPSFKKADKPSFNHHKERREEFEKEKARGTKGSASTTTTAISSSTSAAPVSTVDAATIAYYQQLGYYYDPSYATAHSHEAILPDGEQGQEEDEDGDQSQSQEQQDCHQYQQEHGHDGSANEVEAAGNSKASGSAHTSHGSDASSSKAKPTSTSATSRAAHKNRAAYPVPNPYGPGSTMHPSQPSFYPPHHGFYPGYHPGHLPPAPPYHIPSGAPTAAAVTAGPRVGGFGFPAPPGIPAMPGMVPSGWNGPSAPRPFGQGSSAAGGQGMMPPPPLPSFPPHSSGGGSFSGPKMDDEAFGNLIMAWYFSGYYTGLYQAQRR